MADEATNQLYELLSGTGVRVSNESIHAEAIRQQMVIDAPEAALKGLFLKKYSREELAEKLAQDEKIIAKNWLNHYHEWLKSL